LSQNSRSVLKVFFYKVSRSFYVIRKYQSTAHPEREPIAAMAAADMQVRHLDLYGLRMLLIHIGKLILPQTLDELVRFLYVVPLTFTLHEHAYGDVFGY
jgi:hypothetical protein